MKFLFTGGVLQLGQQHLRTQVQLGRLVLIGLEDHTTGLELESLPQHQPLLNLARITTIQPRLSTKKLLCDMNRKLGEGTLTD